MAIVNHGGRAFLLPDNPNIDDTFVIGGRIWTWDGEKWLSTPVPALPGGTDGQVQFNDDGLFGGAAELVWDQTNSRLGVNMATALYALDVTGDANLNGTAPNPSYRINGIAFAVPNADGTTINLTNVTNINGAAPFTDPSTTLGDLLVHDGTALVRLPVGTNGQILASNSAAPSGLGVVWTSPEAASVPVTSVFTRIGDIVAASGDYDATLITLNPVIGTWDTVQDAITGLEVDVSWVLSEVTSLAANAVVAGAAGQVQFHNGATPTAGFGASASLNWDATNSRLGIGTAVPLYPLQVTGDANITGTPPAPAYRINGIAFATGNDATTVNLGNVNNLSAVTLTINGTAFDPSALAFTADEVDLNPAVSTWVTVQDAVAGIHSTIEVLARGMAYIGAYDAEGDVATFVTAVGIAAGPLPAADATGIHSGDFVVVTTSSDTPAALTGAAALVTGDQLISDGTNWNRLPIGFAMAAITADMVPLNPVIGSWSTVQDAITGLNSDIYLWQNDVDAGGNSITNLDEINGIAVTAFVTGPAGANTQIQYNNNGAFGASANLTYDGTALSVTGNVNITGAYQITGVPAMPPTRASVTNGYVLTTDSSATATGGMVWAELPSAAPVMGAAPAAPTEGQLWFDTTSMSMFIQVQGAWVGV